MLEREHYKLRDRVEALEARVRALEAARTETIRECLAVVQGAESKGDAEDALAEMLGGDRG